MRLWLIAIVCALGSARAAPLVEAVQELPMTCSAMPVTMRQDTQGRPFLYVAAKDGGVRIHALDGSTEPVLVLRPAAFGKLHAMSLTQAGDRLYVALGNHWGWASGAGLAVIDVRDPRRASVLGHWAEPERAGAGGAVEVRGDVAYLASMGSGLQVLDVANPAAIRRLGRLEPARDYPEKRFDRKKFNARGLALRGNRLYLCYDAGGVRVVDVSDPARPLEIGRYAHPSMNGKPRAYNNIAVDGKYAYVTVDYVGVEVLDVSEPARIRPVSWWNPWNPGLVGLKWFTSPGHANEVALDPAKGRLFVSAGRTDLVVLSISDPANPRQIGGFGTVDDTRATWGVSLHGDRVYLSYICTLGIPFRASWAGVQILRVR